MKGNQLSHPCSPNPKKQLKQQGFNLYIYILYKKLYLVIYFNFPLILFGKKQNLWQLAAHERRLKVQFWNIDDFYYLSAYFESYFSRNSYSLYKRIYINHVGSYALIPYKDYTSNLVKISNDILYYNTFLYNTRLRLFKEYTIINNITSNLIQISNDVLHCKTFLYNIRVWLFKEYTIINRATYIRDLCRFQIIDERDLCGFESKEFTPSRNDFIFQMAHASMILPQPNPRRMQVK